MTQLLLFDGPAVGVAPIVNPVPAEAPAAEVCPSPRCSSASASVASNMPASAIETPARGEIHRMGDLARLVIARYDLVAQRRAARRRVR